MASRLLNPPSFFFSDTCKVVELLADVGKASVNARLSLGTTPLHVAAEAGHAGVVAALLARKAHPGMKAAPYGHTPLRAAVDAGAVEVVKALLAAGASVTAAAKDRSTPLLAAVRAKTPVLAIIEALLARGADPTTADASGASPLRCQKTKNKSLKIYGEYLFEFFSFSLLGKMHPFGAC